MCPPPEGREPTSFAAATAALSSIDGAVRTAQSPTPPSHPASEAATSEQVLAALLLLRELREQLAAWEPGLIEAARKAGTSWADLAHPLGVASRQAAERRYLRVRPGAPGATGEQRVEATRSDRAADRSVATWARSNVGDLRQLAGQIAAVEGLPPAVTSLLAAALTDNDGANLIGALTAAVEHLADSHPELADRVSAINRRTDRIRENSRDQRSPL
ncbi:type III effector protein [Streptomyces sp. NPDC057287]|uniref:type III effector protein n=1 Tax=Streptomyces sp. NPDC057287 TaxID=3346086 RepID=UPI003626696C